MTTPLKPERFAVFIEKLKAERGATCRVDAVNLMIEVMKSVEDSYGLPPNDFDKRMNVFPLNACMGWMNLETDPCYWDDSVKRTHRTEVYNSGRIVIKQIKGSCDLVIDKAGA